MFGLFPCLGIGTQLHRGGTIVNGDLAFSGLGPLYPPGGGNVIQCPDSATGAALLWTGQVSMCGHVFNVMVTE